MNLPRSTAIVVWVNFLAWAAMALVSLFLLFRAQDIRYQLLYAGLFVCFLQWATLTKMSLASSAPDAQR